MTPLFLIPSQDIPEITLNKTGNEFEFKGTSIPEDARKLYDPVLDWIDNYLKDPNEETIVNFKFDYFNTASSKFILDIMIRLKELAKSEKMLLINWHFHPDDSDMREAGEGFSAMVRFPFNYIER
jgi:hypothetical protein